jgi:hypothetical protein
LNPTLEGEVVRLRVSLMHTVGKSFVVGQDPTYRILDAASFSKYLAVSSDKLLYIYSIRQQEELVLDLVKELQLSNSLLLGFKTGIFIKSQKTLYYLSQELELVELIKNVYSFTIMKDYILTSTKDTLSLQEFNNDRMILKRETRSSVKYSRALTIDAHTALLEDKSGYYILDVVTWDIKQIYSNSRLRFMSEIPKVTLSRREIIITKDDHSVFFYKNGIAANKNITWPSKVLNVVAFQVYIMGAMDKNIEIRNINTGDLVQILDIQGASVITRADGNKMLICDHNTIWQFVIQEIMEQIKELQGLNQFDLAKELLTSSDLGDEEKLQTYKKIQLEHARYTFQKKDAKKTLELLDDIKASPKSCIDLFLGRSEYDIFIEKKILLVLMDYLSRQRAGIARRFRQLRRMTSEIEDIPVSESAYSMVDTYEGEGFDSEEELLELSSLVDTALFRIYLELNHSLLGSLFRVRNYLDQNVVERILSTRKKWDALVEFYKGKKLHEKALEVLQTYIYLR